MGKKNKKKRKKNKKTPRIENVKIENIQEDIDQNNDNGTTTTKQEDKKKKKFLNYFISVIQLVLVGVIIYNGIKLYKWNAENKKNEKLLNDVSDAVVIDDDNVQVDMPKLEEKNANAVGFIKVNGTNIEYPVVQYTDNSFYLTHSFDDTYNSSGWIFADYRNKLDGTDKNIIIYGHNRRNGTMFANLKDALDEDWYSVPDNRKIYFVTGNESNIYEVFSLYKIEDEGYYITTNFDTVNYGKFLNTIKSRSIADFGVDLTEDDQILTLSTCDNNSEYRIVVHAKKIVN